MNKIINSNLMFLGTGAAEGIPNPLCGCEICNNARKVGGKELKLRSLFRINEMVQIDFGPDVMAASMKHNIDMTELKHILITHTHSDHLCLSELLLKEMVNGDNDHKINIYVSQRAYQWVMEQLKSFRMGESNFANSPVIKDKIIEFIPLEYYKVYEIENMKVVPLKGAHYSFGINENSNNYLITLEDGRTLFYGVDTGYPLDETIEYLKEKHIDLLIIECTFAGERRKEEKPFGHLDLISVIRVLEVFNANGTIDKNTKVYLTHINHKHHLTHALLEQEVKKYSKFQIIVAYDGLIID
ncbi:MBL fold metallo-hydrolase [Clostridium sp. DJ247]|uniref:MBL fold metallo-hydrolase n=1 Tax=Clostridium sp. DJ247 TaxID=2726188 RepID=UPI00162837FA|nr:MBL fold metallo-hydrolase [Clostridium sp. DJ247]MBC2581495.1 hypothetical protein [Clostridium sp. DJ247]